MLAAGEVGPYSREHTLSFLTKLRGKKKRETELKRTVSGGRCGIQCVPKGLDEAIYFKRGEERWCSRSDLRDQKVAVERGMGDC